ncbi:nucleobase-ascorbate transporter 7-like isoform X1 [Hibiscus syriacus]|uniref:Nucleobase-ascorbate transporter 7-like isoform X1 n=1 Tax=Hibiscus syriacus TaxID=106335 RepID=A0A6A2Z4R0_HIBSY|nr:uncharacterized protein LOC120151433 [Hibiscus syriacus]KAE8686593.1 nucleobase-ascorbate transporter 7-like isoform X1 [Hibiscus syriacus]
MGNCQAIDAAVLVIQPPCGKIERMYWWVPASEVMRMNPGHYVSLIIPLPESDQDDDKAPRFTRVKLLRPRDPLALGHAYRLITSQEVMEVLKAKKYAKTKRQQRRLESNEMSEHEQGNLQTRVTEHERRRPRTAPAMSSKSWRPSLQSISESAS